ncbi:MAG: Ig-like domain-containing protein [Pseudomonadota bacterium]
MADIFWSQLRMDDGSMPGPDDVIVVDSDDRLIFDATSPVTIQGLVVYGEFTAEDTGRAYDLTTDWAVVAGDGTFRLGTPEDPYESAFTLTLAGKDDRNDVDLRDYPDACETSGGCPVTGGASCDCEHTDANGHNAHQVIENNNAYLMAMGAGASIEIHTDDAAKTSWTQLGATAEAGSTTLTLAEATGWQPGDTIVIASTDFNADQAETFEIVSVADGGREVTLDRPLEHMHYGEIDRYDDPDGDVHRLDMRAEVGLLSRDVRIQGDIDYDPSRALNEQADQYGGHTMVMHGGEMYLSGVELAFMGQAGTLGRYPAHWHESGDVSGQYIKDSSVHHSFNKGITVHNTQNALVQDNVVFETISHNYYLEQNDTYDNALIDNLGINARDVGRFGTIRGANDDNPSNFYTPNGDNTWIGNHAAGSDDKGFYFSLTRGGTRNFDIFEDNAAHSTDGRAFYLNHAGLIQDGNPNGSAAQPQKVDPWVVDGFTTYKSDGVYVRGIEGTFANSAFAEMGSNARFRLNQTIEDSLIVGRSANLGNPETREERDAGRSLPNGDDSFQGFQLYDGPGALDNVMFDGFYAEKDGAIELSNAIHKSASFGLSGITWGDAVTEENKLSIGGGGNAIGNDSWARGLVDVDGSVTGTPGAMIYQLSNDRDGSTHFNAGETYEVFEEWGAIVTYGQQSATLRIDRNGTDASNTGNNAGNPLDDASVTRSDGAFAENLRNQIPLFDGYSYALDYRRLEQDDFRLYLHDADWGQSFILNLGPVPAGSSFTVDDPYSSAARPAREVSSLEMLEASPDTAVYRAPNGEVTIKLVAEMAHGYLWPQPGVTYNNALHSGVTVLVDTSADLDLAALSFDDPTPQDRLGPPPYAEDQEPGDTDPTPPPNRAPEAGDDTAALPHAGTARVAVLENDTDPDGDALEITAVRAPDGLAAEIDGDSIRVTAEAGFSGTAEIRYDIADGRGGTDRGEIAVTVAERPNEAPVARDDTAGTEAGTPVTVAVLANDADADGDALTVSLVGTPTGGTAEIDGANRIVFTPAEGFTGEASLDYRLRDGAGGSDRATVTITVSAVEAPNTVPNARNDSVTLASGASATVDVLANDRDDDGDPLVITAIAPGDGVSAEIVEGGIAIAADPGFSGEASLLYTVSDGQGGTDEARLAVTVEAPEAPDTPDDPEPPETPEDPAPQDPAQITLALIDAASDTPMGTLEDGQTITLTPEELGTLSIEAFAGSPDVESMVFTLSTGFTQVENRVPYALFGGSRTDYVGGLDEAGSYSLTVSAYSENRGAGTMLGTQTIAFELVEEGPDPAPDPAPDLTPELSDQLVTLAAGMAGRSITLSASDFGTDPEGEALVIDSVTQPANGSVAIAPDGSTLTYTPSASFAGLEVIDVALSEAGSAGESRASATLSIDVEALAMPDFDFALHYTDGGQERIAALEDGMVLPLGALDDRPVSIVAETDAAFDGSVRLTLGDASRIENHEPYALFGDMAGDLHGGMAMEAGSYEVTYAVFAGKDGEGALLGTGALGFAVEPPILEAALYTTASQMDAKVMALIDGSTIDASDLVGHGRLSIGFTATTDAPEIGSVRLRYDGGEQVENVTPYALFGNIGDNFRGGTQFEPGLHEIDVAVFADRNAGGELLETFVFEFEVA